jgi:hypothetical protein
MLYSELRFVESLKEYSIRKLLVSSTSAALLSCKNLAEMLSTVEPF